MPPRCAFTPRSRPRDAPPACTTRVLRPGLAAYCYARCLGVASGRAALGYAGRATGCSNDVASPHVAEMPEPLPPERVDQLAEIIADALVKDIEADTIPDATEGGDVPGK